MTADARYSLARIGSGGLLLDLASGGLFSLNAAAALIWQARLDGASSKEIALTLSQTFDLPPGIASEQVAGTLALDQYEGSSALSPGEFRYEKSPAGYTFARGDEVLMTVDDQGALLEVAPAAAVDRVSILGVLQAIVPKLMALRGHVVLHASAVAVEGAVIAFCGESGSGKTTTARSLGRAGAQIVCEDKLVVRERGAVGEALISAEDGIRNWTDGAASELAARRRVPCDALDDVCTGPSMVIREVGFLSADRRSGQTISAVRLEPLDTASALFQNSFFGADVPEQWARRLQLAAHLAGNLPGYQLSMPGGLVPLDAAAAELFRRGSLRSL